MRYMFTLEMWKQRAVELWNCLDSTCGAALCLSSCVTLRKHSCILFPPVRSNPSYISVNGALWVETIVILILIPGAFNPFLTVGDI